ncbi:hypothetical protein AB0942_07095 [Streptomyces nodosus]|uniref:phage tail protein n=1 Tax=Streptomyces nodosus TaxID=40318 RepID=UPI0034560E83
MRRVNADIAAKKQKLAHHQPATAESRSAQDAAKAPPDDKEAQGKAANAEKMNAAEPGAFNKQAFIDAVNKAIEAQAPKNLDDADKFSKSGKADKIKDEVDGKVSDGKEASAKDIDTATKAPPDTSAAKDKKVTPMSPDRPPPNPGAPSAADAIPEKQPASVTDFSEGPAQNDQAMADAEVTEDQLAKGNERDFDQALSAKKTAEADSAKAPAKGKAAEARQLSAAKAGAAASGAQAMNALTVTRASAGKQVDGGKGETKSKDERRRAEVTAKLQKVYDSTKKDVEETLSGLDKKVDTAFTTGEKAARDAFTADHERRMKAYKDKRYSGWRGKARWVKDKFAGLPEEANNLYQEARKLYVAKMQTVISSVADIIGAELGRAKARIAKGRTELKAEVDKLPVDLRQFGEDAAKDFAGKFDDLEASVNEKSEQLVQDLAQKYTAALNKVDEEIKKLQEANKGLIDKAKDAIVGVIKTINELKNLLLGILARAAAAITKIIKDPIAFLGNLVHAVGAGLQQFMSNIGTHLQTGLVSWLLGTAVKAGLDLPSRFDLKGIIQLIASLLGLTWANIRARITRKGVPDQAMNTVEQSVPVAKALATEGPAGATKEIQSEVGDLKSTILEDLKSYLIPTVIIAGITWILSLLNPASAFVRAVKGIIDIVTFIVNQGAQIVQFVNAVLDAVVAIANGGSAGVPKLIETALAASIPLLIGFLASLLGIGGLANKIKQVFHKLARPVNRAIDKLVGFIVKKGKALWRKLKGPRHAKGDERDAAQKQSDLEKGLDAADALVQQRLDRKEIANRLPGIRRRYQMKELSLVHGGWEGKDELVHVRGKVNPDGERIDRPIPGLYDSVDPDERGVESFVFKGDLQPVSVRDDAVTYKTDVHLMDGKKVQARGKIENVFNLKSNDIVMKEHFLDAIPREKRWVVAPDVPLKPGRGTPLITYVNIRHMRKFEVFAGNAAVKDVKKHLRRLFSQGNHESGVLDPAEEQKLRRDRKLYGVIKNVTLDKVENIPAILQLHQRVQGSGVDVGRAILSTHSVEYVETIIRQAGGRVTSAEVVGGERKKIGVLMEYYEGNDSRAAEKREYHDSLLAEFGMTRDEVVLMDFDVRLSIEPFSES